MARVEWLNLTEYFSAVRVLDHFNLVVEQGEFVVLVAPLRCVRSTLVTLI